MSNREKSPNNLMSKLDSPKKRPLLTTNVKGQHSIKSTQGVDGIIMDIGCFKYLAFGDKVITKVEKQPN